MSTIPIATEKVYVDQPLRLELDSKNDLSTAASVKVVAVDPDGVDTHSWSGSLSGTNIVVAEVPKDVLKAGEWKFQPVAVFAAGEVPGATVRIRVYERGQ